MDNELSSMLLRHFGHHIEIAKYGNEDVCLECLDCNAVILDSEVHDIVGLNDGKEEKES